MPRTDATFAGHDGQQLAARIDRPDGDVRAWAVFAHCFTCSMDGRAASHVSRALARHGIGVLRFDFTGLGASEGDFADTHFSSNLADLHAAIGFLRTEYAAPRLLVGHSLGGAAVLAIAVRLGGRPFTIRREFLADVAAQDPDARIAALDAALLVMHSPVDRVVGIDQAAAIYARAKHPKSFIALDGADHLLTGREDAAWAASLIAAWSARYLD